MPVSVVARSAEPEPVARPPAIQRAIPPALHCASNTALPVDADTHIAPCARRVRESRSPVVPQHVAAAVSAHATHLPLRTHGPSPWGGWMDATASPVGAEIRRPSALATAGQVALTADVGASWCAFAFRTLWPCLLMVVRTLSSFRRTDMLVSGERTTRRDHGAAGVELFRLGNHRVGVGIVAERRGEVVEPTRLRRLGRLRGTVGVGTTSSTGFMAAVWMCRI